MPRSLHYAARRAKRRRERKSRAAPVGMTTGNDVPRWGRACWRKGGNELATGDGADDQQRLVASRDGIWQWGVGGFVRQIFGASEETHEGATLLGDVIADGAAQHWVGDLERVKDRTLRGLALDIE